MAARGLFYYDHALTNRAVMHSATPALETLRQEESGD